MDEYFRTEDFPTLKFKKSTMKFLKQIPDNDFKLVTDNNVQHAEILEKYGLIYFGTLDGGDYQRKQICYKLQRGESYLLFREGLDREKRLANIQSWIAIVLSIIALAVSIMK